MTQQKRLELFQYFKPRLRETLELLGGELTDDAYLENFFDMLVNDYTRSFMKGLTFSDVNAFIIRYLFTYHVDLLSDNIDNIDIVDVLQNESNEVIDKTGGDEVYFTYDPSYTIVTLNLGDNLAVDVSDSTFTTFSTPVSLPTQQELIDYTIDVMGTLLYVKDKLMWDDITKTYGIPETHRPVLLDFMHHHNLVYVIKAPRTDNLGFQIEMYDYIYIPDFVKHHYERYDGRWQEALRAFLNGDK